MTIPDIKRGGHCASLALAVLLGWGPAASVSAAEPEFYEVPFAPGQWNYGRRLDESQLRYCVDPRDPDWEVASAVADAVASALLLEPVRHVVGNDFVLEDLTRVYAVMLEHCDIHMGFKLIPGGYPPWVTLTRAYYATDYAFVTSDPDLQALSDLPAGQPIAATMGSTAHIRLVAYVSALPPGDRWTIFPMGTNEVALDAVKNGTTEVALVWAPFLWGRQSADPAYGNLRVIDPAPLPPTRLGVGALLLSDETFLRTAFDEAVAALTADGTIAAILEEFDFPATAAP
jgi:polar amino acid transport system substrate-binding protein